MIIYVYIDQICQIWLVYVHRLVRIEQKQHGAIDPCMLRYRTNIQSNVVVLVPTL